MTTTKTRLNRRSRAITEGTNRSPNRAMMRAVGFSDEDFEKPIIAVANGQSNITPCNAGLGELSEAAMAAIRTSGGMPEMFGTITISDGISMGTEGMKCSLVSREKSSLTPSKRSVEVRAWTGLSRWAAATRTCPAR